MTVWKPGLWEAAAARLAWVAHLAREGERLLPYGLRVADVAEHDLRVRHVATGPQQRDI